MLAGGRAVAGAPEAVGEPAHLRIAAGAIGQAGGPRRLGADHRRAVPHQLFDLLKHGQVDIVALGQHEQFVTHSVGQRHAAVLDAHPRQDHLGVGHVVVVAKTQGRIDLLGRHEVEALVAIVIAHVGDEQALLEQEAAPRKVIDPGLGLGPPRDARADVCAGVVDPAGPVRRRGVVCGGVEREMVRPVAEGPVGDGLELERPVLPVSPACERLHIDLALAVDVGGARGLFDDPDVVLLPELAARDVQRSERLEGIDGHLMQRWPRPARLGAQQQAMLVRQLRRGSVEGIDQQIAQRLSIVVIESPRRLVVLQRAAGQQRQIPRHVVPASPRELGEKLRRPRRAAQLVAAHVHLLERRVFEVAQLLAQLLQQILEMELRRLGVEMVDGEPAGVGTRQPQRQARVGADESHHDPFAFGDVPVEMPVRIDAVRHVDYRLGAFEDQRRQSGRRPASGRT